MNLEALAPRYRAVVEGCESFLVSYPGNWGALDLAPFGLEIPKERRYSATTLASRDVVDGLHFLDAVTFGDQDMLMPRWVLFDCGEFPGIVYGFGKRAALLPDKLRRHYHVEDRDDAFVPLSMWVAIRCAEEGAWFGHNLSSANLLLEGDARLPGLATLTKAFGIAVTRADKQYGATQWDSASIGLHLRLGEMRLLSAYTPAHTHPETLSYLITVDPARLLGCLAPGWKRPALATERSIDAGDSTAIRALHDELEAGARYELVRAEPLEDPAGGAPTQRLHLRRC
ncbi:MAG: hypothetical protein HY908_04400 [Myxococcales bacterium]|nr:hypothetical protein [Myxococcales bacterium]